MHVDGVCLDNGDVGGIGVSVECGLGLFSIEDY